MIFKNETLEVGDYVAFQASAVPLPEVQAAVISVKNGNLEVISTLLVPFSHSGIFTEDEISKIKVIYPADITIPRESRGRSFTKGQLVSAEIKGVGTKSGKVIAAFDGIVVAQKKDGELITAGAMHFSPICRG